MLFASPWAFTVSFGHSTRMAKQALCSFSEPANPPLHKITFATLIDGREWPCNLVLSHDGSKRDIGVLTGA